MSLGTSMLTSEAVIRRSSIEQLLLKNFMLLTKIVKIVNSIKPLIVFAEKLDVWQSSECTSAYVVFLLLTFKGAFRTSWNICWSFLVKIVNSLLRVKNGIKYSRMEQVKFFKGCLPQILFGLFLNSLCQRCLKGWKMFEKALNSPLILLKHLAAE